MLTRCSTPEISSNSQQYAQRHPTRPSDSPGCTYTSTSSARSSPPSRPSPLSAESSITSTYQVGYAEVRGDAGERLVAQVRKAYPRSTLGPGCVGCRGAVGEPRAAGMRVRARTREREGERRIAMPCKSSSGSGSGSKMTVSADRLQRMAGASVEVGPRRVFSMHRHRRASYTCLYQINRQVRTSALSCQRYPSVPDCR